MIVNDKINMPEEVHFIIKQLNKNHFEAYVVGGCVRDSILYKEPKDWDITTNATPHKVKSLFDKTVDTGIKHGTVTVIINNQNFEVTTYRVDGKYSDNRRPQEVEFTSSLKDDLSRRDFTMNAIAYHPSKGYIDYFNGIDDIKNLLIRTVGNANERFQEDALRMLRAVRFSAQLNFLIDEKTIKAIKNNAYYIEKISIERIRDEVNKILISEQAEKLKILTITDLSKHLIPSLRLFRTASHTNHYYIFDEIVQYIDSISHIENDLILRWALLLQHICKNIIKLEYNNTKNTPTPDSIQSSQLAKIILQKLRFDNKTINHVCKLIEYINIVIEPNNNSVKKAISIIGDHLFFIQLLKLKEAIYKARNIDNLQEKIKNLNIIKNIYHHVKEKHECLNLQELSINGSDLINLGFKQGENIGLLLHKLLDIVIENPELNNKETLIDLARTIDI